MQRPEFSIDLASGGALDLADPSPGAIRLDDVAGGLSRICRFAGQAQVFLSVAQHAVLVSELVAAAGRPELALSALHHDSHEAFACDIPTPLKRMIEQRDETVYEETCERLDHAIAAAFAFARPAPGSPDALAIKAADNACLLLEAEAVLPTALPRLRSALATSGAPIQSAERTLDRVLTPPDAEVAFVEAHVRASRQTR